MPVSPPATAGRRRVRRAFGAAIVGMLAVTACTASRDDGDVAPVDGADDAADSGSADGQSVVVIGDSLTEGSSLAIDDALSAAGYGALAIDGMSSRRSTVSADGGPPSGVDAIELGIESGHDPDAWVIALGTNDVLQYEGVDQYAGVITELMAALPDGVPVVWVDLYLRDYPTEVDAFNAMLHVQLDDRPDTEVAAWSARALEDGVISDDGIHPTGDGQLVFADTIVDGLDALAD